MRRKGIGKTLLDVAINTSRAKDARKIFLEVASDNAAATALYEKSGFREIGKRVHYYRTGADAVMYALDL